LGSAKIGNPKTGIKIKGGRNLKDCGYEDLGRASCRPWLFANVFAKTIWLPNFLDVPNSLNRSRLEVIHRAKTLIPI
jgi:hypothetical protein